MFENIRMSFQGIWSHKMRSFLTMLGIIIGIAAIIAIVSTIKGTNEQIKQNLIGSGENTVQVKLNNGGSEMEFDSYTAIPAGVPCVSKDTIKKLQKIDGVKEVSAYLSRSSYGDEIFYLNTSMSSSKVVGIDERYLDTASYVLQKGRGFIESDHTQFRKVAILDEDAAGSLFQGKDAVGKTIEIKGEPFVVVGLVSKMKEFEPTINSMEDYNIYYSEENSGNIFIPKEDWGIVYQYDEPENILIKVESTDDMTTVGKAAADLMNKTLNTKSDSLKYKAEDLLEQAKHMQELSESTNSMLIWIAGISLIVGGIGVMNIMLVSVTERTQEIGLKKAIGARKSIILGQFLTEAAMLTSLGGMIGVGVGIILSQVISKLTDTPVAISVPAAVGSVLFSMAIGVIFGMMPSYKAANLDPIEALRHE